MAISVVSCAKLPFDYPRRRGVASPRRVVCFPAGFRPGDAATAFRGVFPRRSHVAIGLEQRLAAAVDFGGQFAALSCQSAVAGFRSVAPIAAGLDEPVDVDRPRAGGLAALALQVPLFRVYSRRVGAAVPSSARCDSASCRAALVASRSRGAAAAWPVGTWFRSCALIAQAVRRDTVGGVRSSLPPGVGQRRTAVRPAAAGSG